MIRSMTAFARKDVQGDWGTLTCEIRTVNHRYLEPSFRLPEAFRELENRFREELRKQLKRGKVDVSMRLQSAEKASQSFEISEDMAQAVNEAANHINRMLDNPAHINALDILRWPGVLSVPEQDYSPAKEAATGLFEQTVSDLASVREREGSACGLCSRIVSIPWAVLSPMCVNACRNCWMPRKKRFGSGLKKPKWSWMPSGWPRRWSCWPRRAMLPKNWIG